MIENGQVERIVKKWTQKPPVCTGKTDDLILGLGQVRTPLVVAACGFGVALIIFFAEKYFGGWWSKRSRFYHKELTPEKTKTLAPALNGLTKNQTDGDVDN